MEFSQSAREATKACQIELTQNEIDLINEAAREAEAEELEKNKP